jgi:hypothetical protein
MTVLLKRLRKLEVTAAQKATGPESWPAKAVAVKECAIQRMPPADRAFVNELLAAGYERRQEMIARNPAVWQRFREAFEWATREVPAPYLMCISDLYGTW